MDHSEGYEKVARLMSRHGELSIVRSFQELNFQDLLYQQAELTELEEDLLRTTRLDRMSSDPVCQLRGKHWQLLERGQCSDHGEPLQKILRVRQKLLEYNQCLRNCLMLKQSKPPAKTDLAHFRDWFERKRMGDFPILSNDRHSWDKSKEYDLIALQAETYSDHVSDWLSSKLVPIYHRVLGRRTKQPIEWDPESGIISYEADRLYRNVEIVSTLTSSLLPIIAIVTLYAVGTVALRLALTAVYTSLFSLCLAILTNGRRVEVFAATTA